MSPEEHQRLRELRIGGTRIIASDDQEELMRIRSAAYRLARRLGRRFHISMNHPEGMFIQRIEDDAPGGAEVYNFHDLSSGRKWKRRDFLCFDDALKALEFGDRMTCYGLAPNEVRERIGRAQALADEMLYEAFTPERGMLVVDRLYPEE